MSPDVPASLADALADRYTLLRELGRGGMATVYLAEDVRHRRQVALKVLHPELSAVIGPERFLKEIELTARLQHPHILPLFDSGNAGGQLFYVMPFVDGESLRARLDREQQLPLDDALRIAREAADALGYAHTLGVVHRDVKPENILLQGGHALVADFGIALAVTQAGGSRMTQTGMSLGTPQYMAPEQAMGEKVVDARADIYALGAVTYEMLAGEPPFAGPTTQAIIAKMMTERPVPLHTMRDTVPSSVERAVHKALAKLPADRWESAPKFAEALTSAGAAPNDDAFNRDGAEPMQRAPWKLAAAGAALLTLGVVGGMVASNRGAARRDAAAVAIEFDFETGPPIDDGGTSISDDGRTIAVLGRDSLGHRAIVVRHVGLARVSYLATTEEPLYPQLSPDGRWIAYGSSIDRSIRKISVEGGPTTQVTPDGMSHFAWIGTDSILFQGGVGDQVGLRLVAANGGPSRLVLPRDGTRESFQFAPSAIPTSRIVLFCSYSLSPHVDAVDLDRGTRTTVLESACSAVYAPSGHLLFSRGDALYAIRFDRDRLQTVGEAQRVVDGAYANPSDPSPHFDLSTTGTLVFQRTTARRWPKQLVFRSRDGSVQPMLMATASYSEPRLSPNGSMLLVTVQGANKSLALVDVARQTLSPLLKGRGDVFDAHWFPDGRSFGYVREARAYDLYRASLDGSVSDRPLLQNANDKYLSGVAPDGLHVWFDENRRPTEAAAGDTTTRRLTPDGVWGSRAAPSPNGRWIALESHAGSGLTSVVIMATDGTGAPHRVSLDGGEEAVWTKGGRELVFRSGTAMMAAGVNPETGEAAVPTLLFRAPLAASTEYQTRTYDVTADGARFVMIDPVPGAPPLNVVTIGFLAAMQKQWAASGNK
jgi:eukaryotic-like serine/threonine-protein kinase